MKFRFWRKAEPVIEHTHEPKPLTGIEKERIEQMEADAAKAAREMRDQFATYQSRIAELEAKFGAELQELEHLRALVNPRPYQGIYSLMGGQQAAQYQQQIMMASLLGGVGYGIMGGQNNL